MPAPRAYLARLRGGKNYWFLEDQFARILSLDPAATLSKHRVPRIPRTTGIGRAPASMERDLEPVPRRSSRCARGWREPACTLTELRRAGVGWNSAGAPRKSRACITSMRDRLGCRHDSCHRHGTVHLRRRSVQRGRSAADRRMVWVTARGQRAADRPDYREWRLDRGHKDETLWCLAGLS